MKVLYGDKALEANPHVKAVANQMTNQVRKSKRRRVETSDSAVGDSKPTTLSRKSKAASQGKEIWDAPAPEPTAVDLNPWLEPERERAMAIKAPRTFGGKEKSLIPAVTVAA